MKKMKTTKTLYVTGRNDWRTWLGKNHDREKEIWLVFYKKHASKSGIPYDDAVEEALCFGWIDGTLKRIDSEKHIIRFTPRRKNSVWSEINRKKAEEMIKEGRMTEAGLAKIEEAKKNGKWQSAYTSKKKLPVPPDLKKALMKNKKACGNFNNFASTYQNMYIGWVIDAKRKETRERRIKQVVERAEQNKKPGMM